MTDAGSADPIQSALQERLAGQYTIERLLGQGGMGAVYLARDATLDRPVAIKVISGDVATNPQLKERFLLEARTVAKLRHPNLVAVYAAGDAGGLLWFAMEFVPGESLRDLLAREGKVEAARAERILHELALALDYAHSNGIVHRDVKPENILLDGRTGRAMLTDFGVARALEGDGRMTGTGMILGSPRYMSPEQATGETTIDGRSDLYALALVGYEMFTGKPVVESGNVAGMLVKHLTETPKPLADAVVNVPEGVAIAIDRALTKDRDQRWATGREMAEVIGMAWTPSGATQGLGTRAATGVLAARPETGRLPNPFRKAAVLITAAAVIAIAAAGIFLWRGDGAPAGIDARKSYVVVPFEIQSGTREVQWLRDGAVNMLTLALSQWTDLNVVDYERTLVLVRDAGFEEKRVALDDARSIARRAGAWTIVMGQVSTTTDSLIVVARLYDVASGKSLNTATRSIGLVADPRPLFDGLARYLLDVAGGTGGDAVDLAAATTTSLGAYRSYLDGVRLLNSWRLNEADSAFRRAIEQDSTFALAWHKRSLALGWGNFNGPEYISSAQRAAELADRLPPREQGLVRGHLALSLGIAQQLQGSAARPRLLEAQEIYRTMLASDSTTAEAWYGLADALFHDQQPTDSAPRVERRMTASMRAFHRTLALDSTFHLAYSHLIQMYQGLSTPAGGGVLLVGDSVRIAADEAALKALGGPPALERSRANAQRIGLELAKGWARTDKDAVAPYTTLANSFAVAGMMDSAVATMDRALARPGLASPTLKVQAAFYNLLADSLRAQTLIAEALPQLTPAAIDRAAINDRFVVVAGAMTISAASGNGASLDAMTKALVAYDSLFPPGPISTAQQLNWFRAALRLGMGAPMTAADRRILVEGIRRIDSAPQTLFNLRQLGLAVPYTAYLASRDTVFSNTVLRWGPPQARYPEFEAMDALSRGDTARARTIAATFPPSDSLRSARLSFAGMRVIARAEVLEAVGRDHDALSYYEALDPKRFNTTFIDPGWTVYVRSFAARARLYEQVGDKPKALAAYEEFLRRFKNGDALTDTERRTARAAVQRLKESGKR